MFASIGKSLDASLSKGDFVKLMTLHGASLTGQTGRAGGGGGGSGRKGLFDANTKLLMLAYHVHEFRSSCTIHSCP